MIQICNQVYNIRDVNQAIVARVGALYWRHRFRAALVEVSNEVDWITHIHYPVIIGVAALAGASWLEVV